MTNPRAGRHHPKVVERALAPSQKSVPFAVTLHFNGYVLVESIRGAKVIDHDAVIDDEIDRRERVDHAGIMARIHNRAAHGSQIGDTRYPSKILHKHACRSISDLLGIGRVRDPIAKSTNVVTRNGNGIFET